jgi:hypothetical protein
MNEWALTVDMRKKEQYIQNHSDTNKKQRRQELDRMARGYCIDTIRHTNNSLVVFAPQEEVLHFPATSDHGEKNCMVKKVLEGVVNSQYTMTTKPNLLETRDTISWRVESKGTGRVYASWRASAIASVVLTPVLPFPFLFLHLLLVPSFFEKASQDPTKMTKWGP